MFVPVLCILFSSLFFRCHAATAFLTKNLVLSNSCSSTKIQFIEQQSGALIAEEIFSTDSFLISAVELPTVLEPTDLNAPKKPDNFTLNMGMCIDYLSADLPHIFQKAPNFEIYTDSITLKDPMGVIAQGKVVYRALFASLRLLSSITTVRPDVTVNFIVPDKSNREIDARLTIHFGTKLDGSPIILNAISHYKLSEDGLIQEQVLDTYLKKRLYDFNLNLVASPIVRSSLQRF